MVGKLLKKCITGSNLEAVMKNKDDMQKNSMNKYNTLFMSRFM